MFYEWKGRVDPDLKGKRFHQVIKNISVDEIESVDDRAFGLVGFECDEGVRRNKGKLGAKEAPNQLRKQLANIPFHSNESNVIDIGNVTCEGEKLEEAQVALGHQVAELISHQYTPIILGGGHETLFGHYLGVREALGEDKKIGIINLDAHFDLRLDERPSSGTMFKQILERDKQVDYLCIGIQALSNTEQLFETAKSYNVKYIFESELASSFDKIDSFVKQQDIVMYTICTDVINQAFAPGVSAPAPFGMHPELVRELTKHIVTQEKFLSMDVSEVNPKQDVGEMTSRLMSYIISEVCMHLNAVRND